MAGDFVVYNPQSGGGGGGGGVSSVALALPSSTFTISGSPVTSSGTLTGTFKTQVANRVFAGPTTGADAVPTWRALVVADIPVLTASRVVVSDGSGLYSASSVTTTTLGYLDATSSIQTQLNAKAPLASPSFTGTVNISSLTASQAVFTDGSKNLVSNAITGSGSVVMSASPTLTGTITAAACNFSGAVTIASSLKSGDYHMEPSEVDDGNSGTSDTIDWSAGSAHKSTLTGNVTYTFSNPVTGGTYVLRVLTGAGSFTVTWPAAVKWFAGGGGTPVVTTTASRMDMFTFYYDGTNYWGTYIQNGTP